MKVRYPNLKGRRGFTLMEVGMGTMIIGLGVMAVLQLTAKLTVSQDGAVDMTVAVNLANNIHELFYNLSFANPTTPTQWGPSNGQTLATYNNNSDFDGSSFSPPIDTERNTLSNLTGWTQSIAVNSVDPNHITSTVPDGTTSMERITVTISHLGQTVYTESWLNVSPY
jgi:Tfp pilus assembly protein PilV